MHRLRHTELKTFSKALLELYSPGTLADFPGGLFRMVRRMLSCDFCCYSEYNGHHNRRRLTDPATPEPTKFDIFDTYLDQLPTRRAAVTLGTDSVVKISDFVSLRNWRRTDLYNHIFRPKHLSYQLTFYAVHELPQLGFSLNRSTGDFSEDERTILNLIRPHLVHVSRVHRFSSYIAQTPELSVRAFLVADNHGRILFTTPQATLWMAEYFGEQRQPGLLPEQIFTWLRRSHDRWSNLDELDQVPAPLLIQADGKTLRVTRESFGDGAEIRLLLGEELTHFSAEPLESLGLTKREAEVLLWVSQGKSNGDIGKILGMKERTACKHLERVLSKLGVENRTAAANVALTRFSRNGVN